MVLLLEPGAYAPDIGGIRLERMFLLHDNGADLISNFTHDLEP
jgi:Xaa-Pro aminopeptidase